MLNICNKFFGYSGLLIVLISTGKLIAVDDAYLSMLRTQAERMRELERENRKLQELHEQERAQFATLRTILIGHIATIAHSDGAAQAAAIAQAQAFADTCSLVAGQSAVRGDGPVARIASMDELFMDESRRTVMGLHRRIVSDKLE